MQNIIDIIIYRRGDSLNYIFMIALHCIILLHEITLHIIIIIIRTNRSAVEAQDFGQAIVATASQKGCLSPELVADKLPDSV
jgi:hypothetical protein